MRQDHMHPLKFRPAPLAEIARKKRQEIVSAGLTRRELFKLGLLTSSGYLIPVRGLSAQTTCPAGVCQLGCSPPTDPFVDPLPIPPVLPERPLSDPGFAIPPNTQPSGQPQDARNEAHQFRDRFPPQKFFITRMRPNANFRFSENAANLARIPPQQIWGFNLGGAAAGDVAITPGPTIVSRYGTPILVRRFNELAPDDTGFGVPETSTHLHNFHSGPDSDGGPCDPVFNRIVRIGQFYDHFYTMARAGFDTDEFRATNGDVRETLGTLWYHDHRVDHTAENVYKGLAGFHYIFNEFDTGNENTGFRLPSFPQFDIPLFVADKLFTPQGELCFDPFGFDGLVGDKFVVNGRIQPFFEVQKRRYRFRILDGGPSRFYQFFLTNPDNPSQSIPFWQIANDGNLLPRPIEITSTRISVAERMDVIIDFKKIWDRFGHPSRIWLENRLEQVNGRAPTDKILPAGTRANAVLEFRLVGPDIVADGSFDPEPVSFPRVPCSPNDCVFAPICLPRLPSDNAANPTDRIRLTRTFRFERGNGQWQINGQFMDCTRFRFTVQRNTAERWILRNNSGGWQHPIHIHLEEFRIIRRNGRLIQCGDVEFSRKDVVRLGFNEEIELVMRFRDFRGGYPMHCHNTVHEDHQMMLLWQVQDIGDNLTEP
jgi:FtsP/CotA-like multicopper oxidase with cupredoxin domain